MRRVLLAAAALTIPVSVATFGFSGIASAKAIHTKCTTVTGTLTTTLTLTNCKGGVTGDSSTAFTTSILVGTGGSNGTGGTITWTDDNTTTIGIVGTRPVSATKCPVSGSTAVHYRGKVTAQTGVGDSPIPGKITGELCIDPSGNVTALTSANVV
ncbi:MAG TPA: hypothetical protein VEJ87_11710 [Acidimicrobiales bacterium]|nr:hypothetical protein [Acidimicrobiales bacterium]